MPKQVIQPEGLPTPSNYSYVVRAGDMLFLAGQVASDAQGNVVGPGDIEAQAVQVFENIKLCLASAGATLADLVKITVVVTDPRYREKVNELRGRYLSAPYPASTFIVAALAAPAYLVEIECVAYVGK